MFLHPIRLKGVNLACFQMSAEGFAEAVERSIDDFTRSPPAVTWGMSGGGAETIFGGGPAQNPQYSLEAVNEGRKPCQYPHHPYKLASISLPQRSNFAKSRNLIKTIKARVRVYYFHKAHAHSRQAVRFWSRNGKPCATGNICAGTRPAN